MATITLSNGSDWTTGCIFEGAHGWHNTYRLVHEAQDEGFELSPHDTRAIVLFKASRQSRKEYADSWNEHVQELAASAEEYLNNLAPEGYSFGWNDGEFFLWSDSDWEECQ